MCGILWSLWEVIVSWQAWLRNGTIQHILYLVLALQSYLLRSTMSTTIEAIGVLLIHRIVIRGWGHTSCFCNYQKMLFLIKLVCVLKCEKISWRNLGNRFQSRTKFYWIILVKILNLDIFSQLLQNEYVGYIPGTFKIPKIVFIIQRLHNIRTLYNICKPSLNWSIGTIG